SLRPATPATSTLSLHDALPISAGRPVAAGGAGIGPQVANPIPAQAAMAGSSTSRCQVGAGTWDASAWPRASPAVINHTAAAKAPDRKSTRLNSSHVKISYAVFC